MNETVRRVSASGAGWPAFSRTRGCAFSRWCWLSRPSLALLVAALRLAALSGATARSNTATIEEHFKYGSTGGERVSGFPYWIFQAMPACAPKLLPGG